ncbi:hypothetical protein [Tropicimonas marinistellae]|uniref:hypothetical protein n=1 Tax=Tropicimonas marinistellae TaxID=1739787 RepID=UPI00122E993C|nr:hypothetical protein [Tropicimonas marinistellae]
MTTPALLVLAVVSAGMAALYPSGHSVALLVVTAAVGGLVGIASTPDSGPLRATVMTLSGSFIGMLALVFYTSAAISALRRRTERAYVEIGLRILSAWIAAIAVMMAALAITAS